jgi:hypothetical protein
MRLADTLKKAASLVVEFDDDATTDSVVQPVPDPPRPAPQTKTIEQIVREQPGPNLDDIKVQASQAPSEPVIGPDGRVNFPAIYRMASLPDTPFTAEQVLEVLSSLPSDLPLESKRATLKVTLQAMTKTTGATPESVVADASRKLAALTTFAQSYTEDANEYIVKCEAQIKGFEDQIQKLKASISDASKKQSTMVASCQSESERLDDVLEFFSLDVPPSKYAPKAS